MKAAEEVRERVLRGEPVRFAGEEAEAEREVEAAWVVKAVEAGKRVELENAVVVGPLDLPYRHFHEEFILRGGEVREPADFSYARFERGLHLEGTEFKGWVDFEGTQFEAKASLAGSQFGGGAGFTDVQAEGTFLAGGTILGGPEGGAVFFDRAVFTKLASFRRAVFQRPARFHGVKVGGQADFSGARFEKEAAFDGAEIGGALFFRPEGGQRVEFGGPARFHGVKVGGQAGFNGARFEKEAAFDGAEIAGALFFRPEGGQRVEFGGPARFHGVKVGGQAHFGGARFEQEAGFEGASFSGHFLFDEADCGKEASFISAQFRLAARFFGARFGGRVDFAHARFEQEAAFAGARFEGDVSLREAGFTTVSFGSGERTAQFSPESRVDLAGCTYSRIEISDWRELMGRLAPYARQPWGQLGRALRAAGEDRRADEVYLGRRRVERRRKWQRREFGSWLADGLYALLANYGVRPYRLAVMAAVLLLLGTLFYSTHAGVSEKDVTSGRPGAVANQLSRREALAVSVREFLPVELPLASQWVLWPEAVEVKIAVRKRALAFTVRPTTFATFLRLAGWVLVPLGIAALTGLLRRAPPS